MGIKQKSFIGFLWSSLGTLSSGLISFFITLILARLLTPSDFGVIEILLSISVICNVFIDSGFSKAIIRDQNASDTDLSSIFYFNLIFSSVIYIILFFFAPFLSDIYNDEILIPASRILFFKIIIDAFSIVQISNCYRKFNFKTIAIASTFASLISGSISVLLAFLGFGIWSLVVNYLLFSIVKSIVVWLLVKWRPVLRFSIESLKRYFKFGNNLLVIALIDKTITSFESLLIGKYFSKTDLGFFSQARKFDSLVIQTSVGIVQKVAYPALASVKDDISKLREGTMELNALTSLFMFPLAIFLIVDSSDFICFVFGAKWLEASIYLKIFSCYSMVLPLQSIAQNVIMALGNSRQLLYISIVKQGFRAIVIWALITSSLISFTVGITLVMIVFGLVYVFKLNSLIKMTFIAFIERIYKSLLLSLCSVLLLLLFNKLFFINALLVRFIVEALVYGIFYFLLSFIFNKKDIVVVIGLVKGIRSGN